LENDGGFCNSLAHSPFCSNIQNVNKKAASKVMLFGGSRVVNKQYFARLLQPRLLLWLSSLFMLPALDTLGGSEIDAKFYTHTLCVYHTERGSLSLRLDDQTAKQSPPKCLKATLLWQNDWLLSQNQISYAKQKRF